MLELKKNIIDFLTELRMDDNWNSSLWDKIYSELCMRTEEWKIAGSVPNGMMPYIADLISGLAGGSRFVDDETAIKMEDGEMAVLELLFQLYDKEDDGIF